MLLCILYFIPLYSTLSLNNNNNKKKTCEFFEMSFRIGFRGELDLTLTY